jgi:hypothetical protein
MKKGTSILSAILLFFLTISCNSQKNELSSDNQLNLQGKLGDTITLKKGDSVVFAQQHLKIIFKRILNDSRCPKGTVCIWAGAADGEFKYINDTKDEAFNLGSVDHPSVSNTFKVGGLVIKLVDYLPYPDVNQKAPLIPSAKIIVSQQQ